MAADPARRPTDGSPTAAPISVLRIGARNATFQHWETVLRNRTKRLRSGEFLVHGVRSISAAHRLWSITTLIRPDRGTRSEWAAALWADTDCRHVEMPADMVAELADRDPEHPEDAPELVAVVAMPDDDLRRLEIADRMLLVTVFDRPGQPGNIGTLMRSIDAFGGTGLIISGHGADPYDPRTVRASTGSLFSVPTVRVSSPAEVLSWVHRLRSAGTAMVVLGSDEDGRSDLSSVDLTGPTMLVIGNETRGLSRSWREVCDEIISIPMVGTASSLNAATAGSIVLHEALRQRTSKPLSGRT